MANAKAYYDGPADAIYRLIWGDNIHLGVPCNDGCPHPEAMEHTNEIMADIASLEAGARVLDLGCGYGAAARFLARECGCRVVGINVSEKEMEVANARALEAGLRDLLTFESGDFHSLRYADESFDAAHRGSTLWKLAKTARTHVCVPPNDPRAFADAVIALLEDPNRGAKLGQNGRRYVEDNLAQDVVLSNLVKHIQRATSDTRAFRLD